jgi:hypothetical protein
MSQTIFEKIVAGSIPSYKIYEDEHVMAILDIFPASKVRSLRPYADSDLDLTSNHALRIF